MVLFHVDRNFSCNNKKLCYIFFLFVVFFFFSSRRRHTRLTCDWSSDVCSSDLRSGSTPAATVPSAAQFPRKTGATIIGAWASFPESAAYSALFAKYRCTGQYGARSEEHTSELQSHVNLVCRLLLEKKKKYTYKN